MNNNSRTISSVRKREQPWENSVPLMLYFPLSMFFCELVARLSTFGGLKAGQFFLILLTSLAGGFLVSAVLSLIRNRTALRIVIIALSFIFALVCSSQIVYFDIFGNYYNWADFGMAGEAAINFKDQLMNGIFNKLFPLFLEFLPTILLAVFNKRLTFYPLKRVPYVFSLLLLALSAVSFTVFSFGACADRSYQGTLYSYLFPDSGDTYMNFGVLTASRLNIEQLIFGKRSGGLPPDDPHTNPSNPFDTSGKDNSDSTGGGGNSSGGSDTDEPKPPVVYGDNVLEIDFDELINNESNASIKKLHEYFKNVTPTKKNEYTGMFEGKNLIFLTLEGFSGKVISKELTPTLYKMSTEGFVFNNYYCSVWAGSTLTGEYANLTGNMYMTTSCLKGKNSGNYQPFVLGNQFRSLGYKTMFFHGHTYNYAYGREKWGPNFGYEYYGVGNGLENFTDKDGNKLNTKLWPKSDHEVAKVTVGQYINNQPFHIYYMTISGHANYNFLGGNRMCTKHKAEVQNLPYKYTATKAYIACQLEVELMVKELIDRLDEAGILDNTVFVLAPDHFPYGINDDTKAEGYSKEDALGDLYGISPDDIFHNLDLYRNSLIIWSSSMKEPVIVDTPCSAIDILPTVSNLFGLKYDSRLMTGVDVMSGTDPFVIIKCLNDGNARCWVNKYGSYVPNRGFIPAEGYSADEDAIKEYVKGMNSLLKTKLSYATSIVDYNYYNYLKNYLK